MDWACAVMMTCLCTNPKLALFSVFFYLVWELESGVLSGILVASTSTTATNLHLVKNSDCLVRFAACP